MSDPRQKRVFVKKTDLFILLALLAVALVLFFVFRPRLFPAAPVAVVTVGTGEEQRTQRISLAEDGIHDISGGRLPVHLQVEDGGIRFVNSACPDHLCEQFGTLRHEGDWASCLPAEVTVRVEEA